MPKWIPALSVPRMSSPRSLLGLWANSPNFQAIWRSSARHEATYIEAPELPPEERGGLDPYQEEVYKTQAEMFVRTVLGRDEPGMTWRLSWLEAEMGFPDGERMEMDDTARQDRLIARMRSWRLPTPNVIRTIAQSYAGNDVQTSVDYPYHSLTVRFTGYTLPTTLTQLQAEIIRIVPARLGIIRWEVAFLTWGDAYESTVLWCQIEAVGWTWEQFEHSSKEEMPITVECLPEP